MKRTLVLLVVLLVTAVAFAGGAKEGGAAAAAYTIEAIFPGDTPLDMDLVLAETEKPIKDVPRQHALYRRLRPMPKAIDHATLERIRSTCRSREAAFGVTLLYPGFHSWYDYVEGGLTQLAYAEADAPEILREWYEYDLERGDKELELTLAMKPEYLLFGGSGTITLASPELARKYAIPALARWSRRAKQAGIPSMLHCCGKSRALVDMLVEETDMACINPLEVPPQGDVDLAEVKRSRGNRICLMGNLHTTAVMLRGSVADVERESLTAMRDAGQGGGFILSSGDQCGRETPEANIVAMVRTARERGAYDPSTGTLPDLEEPGR